MPVADGFANVDAVENRGGERLDAHALFGEHRLGFFLEKPAVFLDHQVFGRIGADGVAGGLARPFAGSFLALARLEAGRLQALLGARKTAADAQALGVDPDFAGAQAHGFEIRGLRAARDSGSPSARLPSRSCRRRWSARPRRDRRRWPSDRRSSAPDCGCSGRSCGAASAPAFHRWTRCISPRPRAAGRIERAAGRAFPRRSQIQPEEFVALLQIRKFDGDFGQAIGMRIQQLHVRVFAGAARERPAALSIASSSGSSRFERHDHDHVRRRVRALQLPRHGGGVRGDLFGARLRPHAIGLDVSFEADAADRVGVRIGVGQMRALESNRARGK